MLTKFLLAFVIVEMSATLSLYAGLHWRKTPTRDEEGRVVRSALSALDCLRLNGYWEGAAAGEPQEAVELMDWIVQKRARQNRRYWGGRAICDVVFQLHQFSWTDTPAVTKVPQKKHAEDRSERAAVRVLSGRFRPPTQFATAQYYWRPEYSSRKSLCWLETNVIVLGKVGTHKFGRGATDAEKVELKKHRENGDFQECSAVYTPLPPPPRKPIREVKRN